MAVPAPADLSGYALGFKELQLTWSPPGKWVAVGSSVITSSDGVNWVTTGINPFPGGAGNAVAYNGSYWVVVGYSNTGVAIVRSSDGINWTDASNNPFGAGKAIAWNGSYWLACGYGETTIAKSTDGINWTNANNPFPVGVCNSIAWGDNKWVAVAYIEGGSNANIAVSTNGIDWTIANNTPFPTNAQCQGVAYNGSYWVAVGNNADNSVNIAKSTNGLDWTPSTNNPFQTGSNTGIGIAYGGGLWVATGYMYGPFGIATSTNGMNWTLVQSNITGSAGKPFWNGSYWVVSAGEGGTGKSINGTNWTFSAYPVSRGYANGVASSSINVTGYILQQGATTYTLGPSATSKYISGLTPNTSYTYTLKTDISGGLSDPLTVTLATAAIPVPRKLVGGLTALRDVNLAWTPPAGGINITGYRVSSGGTTYDLTATSKHLTNLTVGTTYNFTVQTDISGEYSVAQSFPPITPIDTVPAPVNLFGYPSVRTANLEWNLAYPYLNVTGYRIHNGGTTYTVGTNKKTTITGLDISAAYSFTIETDISGVYSSTASFGTVTTFTPPKPSGLLSAPASFTSLSLTWTQPVAWVAAGTGGMLVSADGSNWTAVGTGLSPGSQGKAVAWNGFYWLGVCTDSGSLYTVVKSLDGTNWFPSTNNPFYSPGVGYQSGNGIAWNGSYWLVVGNGGYTSVCIAKSTDGIDWTASTNNPFSGGEARGIAWNGTYWVAVGYNTGATDCIAKSTNGMTWTNSTDNPFPVGDARGIAWNGSYWIAVGSNAPPSTVTIAKSDDGMNWTPSTDSPFSGGYGICIAYGGGLWVAGGNNGNNYVCIATSIDGMNWTPSNNNPFVGGQLNGIAWNGSYWVATGNNGANTVDIATSTDGMNWTANTYLNATIYGVAAGPSFTITGYRIHSDSPSLTYNIAPASSRIITGLSGTYSFTIQTDVSGDYSLTAAFPAVGTLAIPPPKVFVRPRVAPTEIQYYWNAPAMYIAGAEGVNTLVYSFDGINWLASTSGTAIFTGCHALAYGNGLWVAGGQGTNPLAYSTDGMIWTGSESGTAIFTSICIGVAYGNGLWVAGGQGTTNLAYSTDGINWNPDLSGSEIFTTQCLAVTYGNGLWVAGGYGVNQLAYSTDGINWTPSTSGNSVLTTTCYIVKYANGLWLAGGNGSYSLAYSTDGINWTGSSNFFGNVFAITYRNGLWVAGGPGANTIGYSRDGINWTASESGYAIFTYGLYGITYNNGLWVAGGDGTSYVAYSTDGINWTGSTSANALITAVAFTVASEPLPVTFRLNSANPSLSYTTLGTNIDITGLTTLTDYSFTVTTDLSGSLSTAVPFRTVKTSARPLPVATLTSSQSLVGGELNLTFSWTDPNDYAYFYVYSLRAATGTKNSIYTGTSDYATLSHTFTGLDPGRTYTFTIRRGNDAGYSTTVSATSTAVFFDPRTVAGLKFWVDAADTAGNGSNVADGTTVTTWHDKSGTANNATGSATLRTDSTGRYMDMSGSSYALTTSSWIYNQYFNVFVVDKPTSYGTLLGATAASTDALNIAYDASGIILSTYGDHSALGTAFESVTAPVNIWCFSNYGGKTAYWNKLVSGKDYSHAASFVTDSLLKLGTYSGRMREVLIYTGVMAEDNREAIQNYLYTKWFTQPGLIPLVPVDNGCVMWLDATDITTVFQDVNGTVPVTGNAQTVLRWNDKSGYENHVDASGISPTYNAIPFDGLPGITVFGEIGGSMQTAPFLQSGDASLFIVAYIIDNTSSFGFFKHDISGNFGLIGNPNVSWRAGPSPNNNIFVNAPDSVPFLFYGTMKKDQLLEGTFVNSTGMQKSYSIEGINVSVTAAPIQLNGVDTVVYGEVIYYNRALTAAEVQQNATYLSNKWRIPIPTETPFSPPAAPGLQLWLDSADPYTVFEDASGLTIWKDRSGLGNNAMPHGSLAVSDGIVFGGSQYLSLPDGALPQGAYSYYAVTKFVGDSTIIHGGSKDISGQLWLQPGPGPNISYSYDGVRFTTGASVFPDAPPCNAVVWNGSYWLAGAQGGGDNTTNPTIAKSLDGFNWTLATDGCFAGISYSLVWGGGQWVNGGYNFDPQSCIRTSPDGLVWTPSETPPFGGGSGCYCNSVAYNGTYWVAVGTNQNIGVGYIAKSTDGITWTESTNNPIIGNAGGSVVWTGSIWFAIGENGRATSTDGMIWATTTAPFPTVSTIAGPAPVPVHNSSLDIKTVDASGASYAATTFDTGRYEIDGGGGGGGGGGGASWVAGGFSLNTAMAYSFDGMEWTVSTSGNAIFAGRCTAVGYGNSLWVAGGEGVIGDLANFLAYSTDGIEWTASTSGNSVFTTGCFAVTYANGLWVAGGYGTNFLAYSTNGINWSASTSGNALITVICFTVKYGNDKWVAGGMGANCLAYSTNGINWTASTSGNSVFTSWCSAVAYANGRWVAGGYGTNQMAYSTDGINWVADISGNSIFTVGCYAVAYGNGKWVAGGEGTNTIAYSTNGIDWTASESGNSVFQNAACVAITYANGLWVAGGQYRLAYSTDGIEWTTSESGTLIFSGYCLAVAYADNSAPPNTSTLTDTNVIPIGTETRQVPGWVAVGYGTSGSIVTSTDGITWTTSTNNAFTDDLCRRIAWNGSYWIAVGTNSTNTVSIAKSFDGMTWAPSTNNPFAGQYGQGIAWNGSYWVAVGGNTPPVTVSIAKSFDGMTWAPSTNNPFAGQYGQGIAWNGSYWVAVGFNNESTVTIAKSLDGMTWTNANNNPFAGGYGLGIAWNGSYWLAVGYSGGNTVSIAKSTNGLDWTNATDNPFSTIGGGGANGIAWNGSYWIAVGNGTVSSSSIAKSNDGMAWTNVSNSILTARGISWNGSYWIAVGGNNSSSTVTMTRSTDGITWTEISNPLSDGVVYGIAPGLLTVPVSKTVIIESLYNGTGRSLFLNGLTGPTDTSSHIQDASNNFIGWDMSGNYMNGTIKEIIVYAAAHTATQRKQVEAYLKAKWYPQTYSPSSMALWLDSTTLTLGRVQTWTDRSGHTDLSQNAIWAQPLCSTDAVTGRQGVQFAADGIANGFTATPFGTTDSWSVFSVQRYDYSSNQYAELENNVCTAYETVGDSRPGWVARGRTITGIVVSTDGNTWTPANNNPFASNSDGPVAYNGSYWLVGGYNLNTEVSIAKSTDGINWSPSYNNPFGTGGCYGIAWNGSYWVAVSNNPTVTVAKSTDGETWAPATDNPFSGALGTGIAWNGSYWVAVGSNYPVTVCIAKSSDGMTWTNSTDNPFSGGQGRAIAWNGSYWVAVGFNTAHTVSIAKSTNGMTWANSTDNPFSGGVGFGIGWNGSYWVAVGYNEMQSVFIAKSTNGMTWTNSTDNPFSGNTVCYGVSWNGSYWVVVGANGAGTVSIAKSTDGMIWTPSSNNPFSGGTYGYGIASGSITLSPTTSVGTDTTSTPSVNEIQFYTGDAATAEIHKAPVLVEEIVNASVASEIINTTLIGRYTAGSLTNNPLRIGFTGSLTPSLRGAMRGYIYEMIVYNRIVAKDEQQVVEGYLSWKWGIPLPTTHPYYMAPPLPQTPFTPLQIAGCQLWLDGADTATIDLSGTTVIAWADKSSAGNNAAGVGGLTYANNTVVFDGSSGYFTTPYTANPVTETVFIVMKYATAGRAIIDGSPGQGNRGLYLYEYDKIGLNGIQSGPLGNTTLTANTTFLYGYTINTDTTMYYNGSADGNGTTPIFGGDGTTSIGAANASSSASASSFLHGTIQEILIYNTPHSTADRQRVEGYLATKWGLQSSLPVNHPYYLPPPVSGPFTPLSITGCQLWLDSADAATVIIDGSTVTQWNDKSDLSNNATGFGNLTYSNGVVFDGSTSYFTLPDGTLPYNDSSYTYFLVLNPATIDITNEIDVPIISGGVVIADTHTLTTLFINQYGDHKCRQDWNYSAVGSATTLNVGQQNLVEMDYISGGLRRFFMNFVETSDTPGVTRIQGNTNNMIGNYNGSAYYSGSISEIIVYNKVLGDSQRASVENYLTAKWNL